MYELIYNTVRKSKAANFLFHKIVESEWIHHVAPYVWLYRILIRKRAKRWMFKPPILEITITDMCNARCVMCPPKIHEGKTIFRRDWFEKAVREASDIGIKKMILTGGEPLLDKDIFNKIVFAKSNGIEHVYMFTNGQLLNEKRAKRLIAARLDSLTISFDSTIKEEYEKIRIGLNFDTVFGHIKNFRKWRKEMNSDIPLLRVNRVNISLNKNSAREYIKTLRPYADIIELIDAHNWGMDDNPIYEGKLYHQEKRYPCNLIFQKLIFDVDGHIKKCSVDNSSSTHHIGHIEETNIQALLDTDFREIKEKMLQFDFSTDGCQNCTHKQSWWVDWEMQ